MAPLRSSEPEFLSTLPFFTKLHICASPVILLVRAMMCMHLTVTALCDLFTHPEELLNGGTRSRAFAWFWTIEAPPLKVGDRITVEISPDMQDALAAAKGNILEIGPDTGFSMPYFHECHKCGIDALYTAEPNTHLHDSLRQSAEPVGLGKKLKILHCGAEPESLVPALQACGLVSQGSVDSQIFDHIISIRTLCCVERPEDTAKTLYGLLKPGGRLVVFEHVINPYPDVGGSLMGRGFQLLFSILGWQFFVGNCRLSQDTERILREAGEWKDVQAILDHWATVPYLTAVFTKAE